MNKEEIIGKALKQLKIADDKEAILLVFEGSEVVVKCDADFCSHTWVEHIEMCELPANVLSVEDISMNKDAEEIDGDYIQYYGCKIKTTKGEIIIDYRNSSNGYYGGDLRWGDEYFYGGVYGQNVSTMQWKNVDSDI